MKKIASISEFRKIDLNELLILNLKSVIAVLRFKVNEVIVHLILLKIYLIIR